MELGLNAGRFRVWYRIQILGTLSLRCKRSGANFAVLGRLIKNRRLQISLHVVYDTTPETCVLAIL